MICTSCEVELSLFLFTYLFTRVNGTIDKFTDMTKVSGIQNISHPMLVVALIM